METVAVVESAHHLEGFFRFGLRVATGSDDLLELSVEESSKATFTLSYLQDIANAAGANSEVCVLELSTDMPVKLDFELLQGKLVYYLAPCIGV